MDARLVNIEEKIAHLERHLGELDGVVREMFDRMDGFKSQIEQLRQDLAEHRAGDDDPAAGSDEQLEDDKPPHW